MCCLRLPLVPKLVPHCSHLNVFLVVCFCLICCCKILWKTPHLGQTPPQPFSCWYGHSSLVDYLAQVIQGLSKETSLNFLLHFWIDIGSYDHHAKYKGVFPDLLENTFFIIVPTLDKEDLSEFKGGTLMKKVSYRRFRNTLIFFVLVIGTHTN